MGPKKIFFFNVLGLVDSYFLEIGRYLFLKKIARGVWLSRFSWIWVKIALLLQYKNGRVEPAIITS